MWPSQRRRRVENGGVDRKSEITGGHVLHLLQRKKVEKINFGKRKEENRENIIRGKGYRFICVD